MMTLGMVLFGDSDISRWPPSLYPTSPLAHSKVSNYGKSGAELADLSHQINQWEIQIQDGSNSNNTTDNYVFACCAGENDIGSGRSVDQILEMFRAVLDALLPPSNSDQQLPCNKSKMIFFGPKFEPWLTNDNASRKKYAKLNNGFQRAIRKHHASNHIMYIDCLTLFCTKETSNAPGAVYGGRAMPDHKYFNADGLHLNDVGYGVWKHVAEEKIAQLIDS
mmetsp:Transcript_29624/g.62821  ORF Transcript_29624/g.62821 Transcript_29624/m.62821 type:complete len:221 (-) Transcript_29624:30-692(-)